MRDIRYADRFINDVAEIDSQRLLNELDKRLAAIERFPEMSSPDVRPSLTQQLGAGLRKLPLPPSVIVYRYQADRDLIEFLALPRDSSVT